MTPLELQRGPVPGSWIVSVRGALGHVRFEVTTGELAELVSELALAIVDELGELDGSDRELGRELVRSYLAQARFQVQMLLAAG